MEMKKRVILHVDMNNFYASVECLLNPALKNYAVAVAGDPNKRTGIILAKNYLAKVFGVKTGEVIWMAKQKCPTLICVAPHFDKYEEFSKRAFEIYSKYTDLIEPFGIDECWLDVTDSLKLFNSTPSALAKKIQDDIFSSLGLSVSIGVSFGKTLAKLGSDMQKPMGLTVIDENNHIDILKKLNIEEMIMIGKHTAKKLREMNINKLYDLYIQDPAFLKQKFGVVGLYMHNAVSGIDDDKLIVPKEEDIKSVGNGSTAVRDMTTDEEIKDFLHDLSVKVSRRLRTHGFSAKTIHLSIKFADFTYLSAQHTKDVYFSNEQDIFNFSYEIFRELTGGQFAPVRALRICTTNLTNKGESKQVNLFTNIKNEKLCSAIDSLKEKYGEDVISLAKDFREF
ncbi:MAG: DNA polymerase IV [Clostridiales bacterium]|nr:DNA polymerase IV [Clostridiales bacterium]